VSIQEIQAKIQASGVKVTINALNRVLKGFSLTPDTYDHESDYERVRQQILENQTSALAKADSGAIAQPKATLANSGNVQEIDTPNRDFDKIQKIAKSNAQNLYNDVVSIGEQTKVEFVAIVQENQHQLTAQSTELLSMVSFVNDNFFGKGCS
jgi:hypothetical protein